MIKWVAVLLGLGLVGAVLLSHRVSVTSDQAPSGAAVESRFLSLWVEVRSGSSWVPLSVSGPDVVVQEEEHREILAKAYDHARYAAIPTLSYHYRTHPPTGVRYRILLRNKTDRVLGVLLSVDGANTIDSRPASANACTEIVWGLRPGKTYAVEGFQATSGSALAFRFTQTDPPHAAPGSRLGEIRADVFLSSGALADALVARDTASRPFGLVTALREQMWTSSGKIIPARVGEVPWTALTCTPVETLSITYSAKKEPFLGIVGETNAYFGVTVLYVIPWSPAARAGIQPGQIISHADGVPLYSVDQLRAIVQNKRPGSSLVLRVHGAARATEVRIGEW